MSYFVAFGIGTHMDAPSHCITGGRCIDDFDINNLCMPCVVINVSDICHKPYVLDTQDVRDFESKFGSIPKGSCVIVKTGWAKLIENVANLDNMPQTGTFVMVIPINIIVGSEAPVKLVGLIRK